MANGSRSWKNRFLLAIILTLVMQLPVHSSLAEKGATALLPPGLYEGEAIEGAKKFPISILTKEKGLNFTLFIAGSEEFHISRVRVDLSRSQLQSALTSNGRTLSFEDPTSYTFGELTFGPNEITGWLECRKRPAPEWIPWGLQRTVFSAKRLDIQLPSPGHYEGFATERIGETKIYLLANQIPDRGLKIEIDGWGGNHQSPKLEFFLSEENFDRASISEDKTTESWSFRFVQNDPKIEGELRFINPSSIEGWFECTQIPYPGWITWGGSKTPFSVELVPAEEIQARIAAGRARMRQQKTSNPAEPPSALEQTLNDPQVQQGAGALIDAIISFFKDDPTPPPGRKEPVNPNTHVVRPENGKPYIRTNPDGNPHNNINPP